MSSEYFEAWDDHQLDRDQKIYELFLDVTYGLLRGDVLDIGCGSRIYYDTSFVERWVGVDLSDLLLSKLRFLGKAPPGGPIETVKGSCETMSFEPETFDCACAFFLLHHLGRRSRAASQDAVKNALQRVHHSLKPGGRMVVLESWPHLPIHLYNTLYPALYPMAKKVNNTELPYFFSARSLERIARDVGFARAHIMAIPTYERNYWPVLNIVMPGIFERIFHKYGLYIFVK